LNRQGSTAAKIIIYERSLGKENGDFPALEEGVYVLLRTRDHDLDSLGVAPKHGERCTFFKANDSDLDPDLTRRLLDTASLALVSVAWAVSRPHPVLSGALASARVALRPVAIAASPAVSRWLDSRKHATFPRSFYG
jgi:hypothetical protein